tara:strand:- start:3 stop:491 length:489 start_codon:yes stop_codon:yes gene_type:complete
MPRFKRTYNTRLIKRDYSYDIKELSELLGVHIRTIREWIKSGLGLIDKTRPYLMHGSEIIFFLKDKQSKRKHPCKLHEFFCFKCQAPRQVWEDLIDIKILGPNRLQLMGICKTCTTKVFKTGSVRKIPKYIQTFNIQKMEGQHIIELTHPTLMCHFERTNKS